MRVWLYRGLIYVAGADAKAGEALQRITPGARYHNGHKRWRLPLSHHTVTSMRESGFPVPTGLRAWEREQEGLDLQRKRANELKDTPTPEIRRRLEAIGVRFREDTHKAREHQVRAVGYGLRLAACGLFMDTGTGKTAVAATIMQALYDLKGYRRFLVVAPKTILDVGWGNDVETFSWLPWVNIGDSPAREPVTVCPRCGRQFKGHVSWGHMKTHMKKFINEHGMETAKLAMRDFYPQLIPPGEDDKRVRLLAALASTEHNVFVINPEAFKLVIDDLSEQHWDMAIVDESSMLKSPKAKITDSMIGFGYSVRRRVCMTATPRPNHSLDVWGQMAFIDYCLGGDYYRFRDEWYYVDRSGYKWLPKTPDVDRRIWKIVEQRTYRVRLDDCVDLEGETIEEVSVDLSPELDLHYQDMLDKMEVKLDSGELVDTQWKIVQRNKLAQITSGYIFDNDGEPQFLADSPKIMATVEMVRRLIEEEDRSPVIWMRYTDTEGRRLEELLAKYGVSTGHGGTKDIKSSVRAFMSRENRVMIAHAASCKWGHTWTVSNVDIFHSYDDSWESFFQAKRRIYRMGQTKPVTHVVVTARGTVDQVILNNVFRKERQSDNVVDDLTAIRQIRRKRKVQI
jgi:SNF2 family DNA or RNA helicase